MSNIFLKNGTVLNVYSGELIRTNVAVEKEKVSYIGPRSDMVGRDTLVLDVSDKVLVPGYIDPHVHPWVVYNPHSIGEEALRRGTTTLFCDNLVFYILMGPELFEAFMGVFSDMPPNYFWSCRAFPQSAMEGEDKLFSVNNLTRLLNNPCVQSMAEITRWKELVKGNARLSTLMSTTRDLKKRIDGHTAGAGYDDLNALSRAGVDSCHESISGEDVLNRLRLGLYVMLRQSSLRQDLGKLLETVVKTGILTDRIMLTTDGSTPAFYREHGVTDNLIRIAIRKGVDPVAAYRMSTINPASYFGLDHRIGGIAPGRFADILVLSDLLNPTPEIVLSKGDIVAENGNLLKPFPRVEWHRFFPKHSFSKRQWRVKSNAFDIPFDGKRVRFPAIRLISPVITRTEWTEFDVNDGVLDLGERDGFCLAALLSKDGAWVTNGVVRGFADTIDGMASSYNTAFEILVIGRKPEEMAAAANRVIEMQGGIVAVEKGTIAYEFPLPLGGMMSDAPVKALAREEKNLIKFLAKRGHPYHDPFFTFAFLPNDFLPDVRINRSGVIDIRNREILWPRRDL